MASSALATLSVAARLESYKLASGEQWLVLADIIWPDGTHLRLVRGVDDVIFDADDGAGPQIYTAFNFDFGELEQRSDGSIPKWAVKCSNINRLVEAALESYSGGVGGSIAIYTVNTSNVALEVDIALFFDILASSSNAQWVTFQLGAPSPFRYLHPRHVYTSNRCIWIYKSLECGYAGVTFTGDTTTGSADIANVADTTGLADGMSVSGPGIPAGVVIAPSGISGTDVTISANATATATGVSLVAKLPSCSLRIDGSNGCRAHANQQRFGAFPGIDSNGIRIVSVR